MSPDTTCRVPPLTAPFHSNTVSYVRERRCPSGGYCFYRLDEPNAGDTFYALQVLSLLGQEVRDEETAAFLQGLQERDGSFPSHAAALFAGRALQLLGASPCYEIAPFITRSIPRISPETRVIETLSLFEPPHTWLSLFFLYGVPLPDEWRDQITTAILGFQVRPGGFGSPNATLQDTWRAAESLAMLCSQDTNAGALSFLRSCEDPEYGYIGRPGSRPAYLEDVHAGVRLSALLGTAPRYAGACREFIGRCAHQRGGFTRSVFGGAPTLEFTALAVEALAILGGGALLPVAPIGFIHGKVQPESKRENCS